MYIEQISVFLENKSGRLAEVTGILAESNVNIRALALADTSEFGVLRLIVDDNQRAISALKAQGFAAGKTNVVAVEVDDRPGGLHAILSLLHQNRINVEYMYAFVRQTGQRAIMIFRLSQPEKAVEILKENQIAVIDGAEIHAM